MEDKETSGGPEWDTIIRDYISEVEAEDFESLEIFHKKILNLCMIKIFSKFTPHSRVAQICDWAFFGLLGHAESWHKGR